MIDRPREYAAAGVPYFLRVDLRNRVPALALYEMVDGEYRPFARREGRDPLRDAAAVRVGRRSGRPARRRGAGAVRVAMIHTGSPGWWCRKGAEGATSGKWSGSSQEGTPGRAL
ncbi:hypothetical protein GCM10027186_46330 [Micromonospora schwarzwaldensis]